MRFLFILGPLLLLMGCYSPEPKRSFTQELIESERQRGMTARPEEWYDKNRSPTIVLNEKRYGFYNISERCSKTSEIRSGDWVLYQGQECSSSYLIKLKLVCKTGNATLNIPQPLRFKDFSVKASLRKTTGANFIKEFSAQTNHEGIWSAAFDVPEHIGSAEAVMTYQGKEYFIPFGDKLGEIIVMDSLCEEKKK